MLRTFISNPTLGGFGGESSMSMTSSPQLHDHPAPDAFCQIIKELIDNAVDACTVDTPSATATGRNTSTTTTTTIKKRVRVVIEQCQTDSRQTMQQKEDNDVDYKDDDDDDGEHKPEILRVMVSDNGCGMEEIQACIGAFHTSKAHNSASSKSNNISAAAVEAQTAGRYGIGLTLCLLHAQRLVPDSCAFIQSARSTDPTWSVVTAVVDADQDVVQCVDRPSLPKSFPSESGTSISILVPVCLRLCLADVKFGAFGKSNFANSKSYSLFFSPTILGREVRPRRWLGPDWQSISPALNCHWEYRAVSNSALQRSVAFLCLSNPPLYTKTAKTTVGTAAMAKRQK